MTLKRGFRLHASVDRVAFSSATRNEATFGHAVHVGSERVKLNYHGDRSTLPFRHGTISAPLSSS